MDSKTTSKLEKGQYLTVTLYKGPSFEEAEDMFFMLKCCYKDALGMPIPNSTFSMKIDDFRKTATEDLDKGGYLYVVEMKGVLI